MRSFNSLRMARQTLELGYFQQAMTLVRMAMEDQLVAEDIEHHPPTLAALLDGEGKLGRGNLALGQMAKRLSPKAKVAWDRAYGMVSEYSAHPRHMSLRGLISSNPYGQFTLRPGGHYDKVEVNAVLFYALSSLIHVMTATAKVTGEIGSDLVTSARPVFDEVGSLWKQLDEWACQELEQSAESFE